MDLRNLTWNVVVPMRLMENDEPEIAFVLHVGGTTHLDTYMYCCKTVFKHEVSLMSPANFWGWLKCVVEDMLNEINFTLSMFMAPFN